MAFATERYMGVGVRHAAILLSTGGGVPTIVEKDLLFVRNVTPEPESQDITFEGDDQSERLPFLTGMRVTIECDKFDLKALSEVYGKNVVTTITGVEKRLYFGEAAEVAGITCGVVWEVAVKDEVSGTAEVLRYVMPRATAQVLRPSPAQYQAKHTMQIVFSAKKATTDIIGVALAGVPVDGCFWYLDKLV